MNIEHPVTTATPEAPIVTPVPEPVKPVVDATPDVHSASAARTYIFDQPMKQQDVATPFWPKLDKKLAIKDMPLDQVSALQGLVTPEGRPDGAKITALLLIHSLVFKESGDSVFQAPGDTQRVAELGTSIVQPLSVQLMEFLGLTPNAAAVEEAKKNLSQTQGAASNSGSQPA